MIKMDKDKLIPEELRFLEETPDFLFTLTGSRSFTFGKIYKDSDWDFFIEESKGLLVFLQQHEFVNQYDAYQNDPLNTAVYRKDIPSLGTHVDIQVVNDVQAKIKMNSALKMHFPYGLPEFSNDVDRKLFTKRLWRLMYQLYRC